MTKRARQAPGFSHGDDEGTLEQRMVRMARYAVGTADGPGELAERFDVDEDDVEEILADLNVETCPGCGWWVESGELADENGDEQHCTRTVLK